MLSAGSNTFVQTENYVKHASPAKKTALDRLQHAETLFTALERN